MSVPCPFIIEVVLVGARLRDGIERANLLGEHYAVNMVAHQHRHVVGGGIPAGLAGHLVMDGLPVSILSQTANSNRFTPLLERLQRLFGTIYALSER